MDLIIILRLLLFLPFHGRDVIITNLIIMLSCEEHPVAVNHVGFYIYSFYLSLSLAPFDLSGASSLQVRIFSGRKLLDLDKYLREWHPVMFFLGRISTYPNRYPILHLMMMGYKVHHHRKLICLAFVLADLSTGWWLMLDTFVATQPHTTSSTAHLKRKETTKSFLKFRLCIINIICAAAAALPRPPQPQPRQPSIESQVSLHINFLLTRCLANQRHRTSFWVSTN